MSYASLPKPLSPEQVIRSAQERAIRRRRRKNTTPKTAMPLPFTPVSASQQLGHAAESQACYYVTQHGLCVLARNLKCRAGEIDIVARDQNILVFIEVRCRRNANYGSAAETVGRHKQKRVIRAAQFWLPHLVRRHFKQTPPCRFDIIALNGGRLCWLQDAFRTV